MRAAAVTRCRVGGGGLYAAGGKAGRYGGAMAVVTPKYINPTRAQILEDAAAVLDLCGAHLGVARLLFYD